VKKKTSIIGGSAIAVTLALLGGTALTAGAFAAPGTTTSQVAPISATGASTPPTDVEATDTPDGTNVPDADNVQDGSGNNVDGAESEVENARDDVNGVPTEGGTAAD